MNLFSPVGIEPTFAHISYLEFKEPDYFVEQLWVEEAIKREKYGRRFISINYKNIKDMELASWGNIEIPSPVFNSIESLEDWFNDVCTKLKKEDWLPSTLIEEETEGGCHINYTITSNPLDSLSLFVRLNQILNTNPSIVWSFLSYNDNHSSKILTNKNIKLFSKEQAVCSRQHTWKETSLYEYQEGNYMELRFFQMPKTLEELKFHIKFSTLLMDYAYQTSNYFESLKIPLTHSKKDLQNFTFEDTIRNLKKICRILGIRFQEFEEFGKIDNLRKRFELDKNYLV